MNCAYCGGEFIPGARFCAECGRAPDSDAPVMQPATSAVPVFGRHDFSQPAATFDGDDDYYGDDDYGGDDDDYERAASGETPRLLVMAVWGALGGLLAVPAVWLAGQAVTQWSENQDLSNFALVLRVSFGATGAAAGFAIALGVAFGRVHAGDRFNPLPLVVGAGAVGAAFAMFDTVLFGANETQLVAKAAGLGALIGLSTSLSLGGAAACAAVLGGLELLTVTRSSFALSAGADSSDLWRHLGVLAALGAACGIGASLPTGGVLRWPSRTARVLAISPMVLATVALVAVVGAGAVTAKEFSDIGKARDAASSLLDSSSTETDSSYSDYTATTYVARETFTPIATWRYTSTKSSGDKTSVSLAAGRFYNVADAPAISKAASPTDGSCSIDEERDLVAPFTLTLTNANAEFGQEVLTKIVKGSANSSSGGPALSAVVWYFDGPDCKDLSLSDTLSVKSTETLDAGESTELSGYLILSGARSPLHPDGDAAAFGGLWLVVQPQYYDTGETITTTSGPWRTEGTGSSAAGVIPLDELRP